MKELRPTVNKLEWRVAYAFDPERRAILLVAAAKGGTNDKRFYRQFDPDRRRSLRGAS
jgi:hypothetical protein